jgi:hypothetical protein
MHIEGDKFQTIPLSEFIILLVIQTMLHFHSKGLGKKHTISHLVSVFIKCVDALSAT